MGDQSDMSGGPQLFARLVRECLHVPGRVVAILVSLVCLGGARLYLTWLVNLGVAPLEQGDHAAIAQLWTRGALTTALLITALFASRYLLNSVNQTLVLRLRDAAHGRLLSARLGAVRSFRSGELLSRIFNDAGLLAGFVRDVLKRLIGESIVVVGGIAMMVYLQWQLALGTCLMVPIVAVLLNQLGTVIRRRGQVAQQEIGTLNALLNEQLRGLATIKGFQTEAVERDRFARQNALYRRQVMRGEQWSALLVTTVSLVGAALLFGVLWYGSQQVMAGQISQGSLLAFCLYAVQTIEPIRRLSEVHGTLQGVLAAAARVYEVIDFADVEHAGDAPLALPVRGALWCDGVGFGYRADEPVLEDLDVIVAPRETVALVAASGGGKSTVANLLARFVDPDRGRILLDGVDLRTLRLAELRRAICVVEQEPFIFSGPLIENIVYGSWHASPAAIAAAVTLAGLEPLVGSLPGGLQAPLLEGGRDLSGGQKQRIALARAIVREPAVLVLDEATSALDSDSERQIFAQLEEWLRQRTVIVMAHRLATISRFDRVLVLEGGRLVGDGTVPALLQRCPAFGRLFAEQLAPLGWGRDASAGAG